MCFLQGIIGYRNKVGKALNLNLHIFSFLLIIEKCINLCYIFLTCASFTIERRDAYETCESSLKKCV